MARFGSLGVGFSRWTIRRLNTDSMSTDHTPRSTLSLLGFPVQVRPGFVLFLLLIVVMYGGSLGVWTAGTIAVFTVVHELGHALAARRFGANARISLDFLMAYAAYQPSHPMTWRQKAAIALAGPTLQISLSSAILLASGVNPLNRFDIGSSEASIAVWWAGIALGVLNLVPVLPLDGGAVMNAVLQRISPRHGERIAIGVSVALTTVGIAVAFVIPSMNGFLPFVLVLAVFQFQSIARNKALDVIVHDSSGESSGDPVIDAAVTDRLVALQRFDDAVEFGARSYSQCPYSDTAINVARALVGRGDNDGALAWIRAAVNSALDQELLNSSLESSEEFVRLHGDPRFDELRSSLLLSARRS